VPPDARAHHARHHGRDAEGGAGLRRGAREEVHGGRITHVSTLSSTAELAENAENIFSLRAPRARRFFSGAHMVKTLKRAAPAVAALGIAALWMTARPTGQAAGFPSTKNGEWTHYTADIRGSKYMPLDQITAANFNKLEVAWRFKTDSFGPRPEYKLEGTPLMIKGVLYTTAGTRRSVIALDAKTSELMWAYRLRAGNRAAIAPRQLSGR